MKKLNNKLFIILIIFFSIIFIGLIIYFCLPIPNTTKQLSVKELSLSRINEIRQTTNTNIQNITGNIYYISNNGNDLDDGKTPQTAWKTLSKLQSAFIDTIQSGDYILFNRGDVFRGNINVVKDNILIGSYGDESKPKPEINVSPFDASIEGTWIETENNIWKYSEKINSDVGAIWFFKDDNSLSNKHDWSDFSYEIGQKVSFDSSFDESSLQLSTILKNDLEFYHTGKASSGVNTGEYIYVYSSINPQSRFDKIEFSFGVNGIYGRTNLVVDNLKIVFAGNHGIGTGSVANLTVTNCEFGYIGGSRQNQDNVRFGNAIEIYGQVTETNGYKVQSGFVVDNNYIYEVYDAGITFQYTSNTSNTIVENVKFINNVVEKCNYSIEYWNVSKSTTQDKQNSYIKSYQIQNNILRYSGYGVSQTRPDKSQSAHIKTWVHDADYENNVIGEFNINNNIFYTSSEQMLAIYACNNESIPQIKNNKFYNDESIPLGYVYSKELSKKTIPFVNSKMSKLFPDNEFIYTTDFIEELVSGTSKDVNWKLNIKTGKLDIYGNGEMQDYTLESLPEWHQYSNFINEITIGENVTKLGNYSFYNLEYVENITINSINLQDLSYDKINFNNGNNFTFYKTGKQWYGITAEFGENVIRVPSFLFWPYATYNESPNITQINFKGNKIYEIGNHAFSGNFCNSIEIPEGVISLGPLSISNSPTLKFISLPDSLMTLSAWALAGNYYLEKVIIGKNINSLENNLFYANANLQQIIIKGNISETANISNIFSSNANNITLYGNTSVKIFVDKYNSNSQNHKINYEELKN